MTIVPLNNLLNAINDPYLRQSLRESIQREIDRAQIVVPEGGLQTIREREREIATLKRVIGDMRYMLADAEAEIDRLKKSGAA